MVQLSSNPISTFLPFPCPCCGTKPPASPETRLCICGYVYPIGYSLPYDFAWTYEEPFLSEFHKHSALHLLGRFVGKNPERLIEFDHIEYLSLSRYPKLQFNMLEGFNNLRVIELDYQALTSLDGIEQLPLRVLRLTEFRHLIEINALRDMNLISVDMALCNKVKDYSPIGDLPQLKRFLLETNVVLSLDFLRKLSNLSHLFLAVDRVESDVLDALSQLPNLIHLGLRKRLLGTNNLIKLREKLPNCKIDIW